MRNVGNGSHEIKLHQKNLRMRSVRTVKWFHKLPWRSSSCTLKMSL